MASDIDDDGDVDMDDVTTFIAALLGTDSDPGRRAGSDLHGDGFADGKDVSTFMGAYMRR